jgi:hypothetical protein
MNGLLLGEIECSGMVVRGSTHRRPQARARRVDDRDGGGDPSDISAILIIIHERGRNTHLS